MKVERLGHPESIKELQEIKDTLDNKEIKCSGDLIEAICKVAINNNEIWALEASIRNKKEKILGLKEVGRRALKIRDFNAKRIEAKNKIGNLTKTGFKEIKYKHRSERNV